MQIQPYRVIENKKEDSLAEIYEFIIVGSNKYRVLIEVDSANDLGLTGATCTCPDFVFRKEDCKHIQMAKVLLEGVDDGNLLKGRKK